MNPNINKIHSLKLSGKEEIVKDVFILQCWTGQRFSDMLSLNKGIVKDTDNGHCSNEKDSQSGDSVISCSFRNTEKV